MKFELSHLERLIRSEFVAVTFARGQQVKESADKIKALAGHVGYLENRA